MLEENHYVLCESFWKTNFCLQQRSNHWSWFQIQELHSHSPQLPCCMPVFMGPVPVRGVRYRQYFMLLVSSGGWIDFWWKSSWSRQEATRKGTCAQLTTPFVISFLAVGELAELNSQLDALPLTAVKGLCIALTYYFMCFKPSLWFNCFAIAVWWIASY